MRRKEMVKAEIVMNTIRWINETFVPKGLKPIEDLPQALPGFGGSCVIARVLQVNPKFKNAHVGASSINLGLDSVYRETIGTHHVDDINKEILRQLMDESYIDLPTDVKQFIIDFDEGGYPELINMEEAKERIEGGWNLPASLMDDYYAWLERKE